MANNIVIDIPPELIQYGKTLLIEKHSELFLDGYHLSKPSVFVRQVHGLCLVDSQQQDHRSVTPTHLLESTIDDEQLVQIIIEFPPECLNIGKSVIIEKSNSNEGKQPLGNFKDLYNEHQSNKSSEAKDIHIQIPKECIERGNMIVIHKEKVFSIKANDYLKQQSGHFINNQFAKRDHLQSKSIVFLLKYFIKRDYRIYLDLMEMTIEIPPEFLLNGQTITFRKEDAQSVAANFPYRRHSKTDAPATNNNNLQKISMEEFLLDKTWNPLLLENGHLLQLSLDFTNRSDIHSKDQLKIVHNGHNLHVEINNQQASSIVKQVLLPEQVKLDQLKSHFDGQHHCLIITLPVQ
ncbi:unnamed protein product [Adineta steineri]|uniref:PIH1 N-terminal domain-containing protein n=1 Tax=Adineta steineri TaxID=433720 RepID=A0A814Q2U2_9BILA|nr:unnamed protein product [Adineta steineri]